MCEKCCAPFFWASWGSVTFQIGKHGVATQWPTPTHVYIITLMIQFSFTAITSFLISSGSVCLTFGFENLTSLSLPRHVAFVGYL